MSPELEQEIIDTILEPTVNGMAKDGVPFRGVLYAGIMLVNGRPYLLEYNVRFGDPECQPVMMRLNSDLAKMLYDAAHTRLREWRNAVQFHDQSALCVVLTSSGYPGKYEKNKPIHGADVLELEEGDYVFQAGTRRNSEGALLTAGGRVMSCCARCDSLAGARKRVYELAGQICWDGLYYRRDIGNHDLDPECGVARG
jgi:phosphoribosylamine--glycine ligase